MWYDWDVALFRGACLGGEWMEDKDYHYLALDLLIVRLLLVWEKV
jgi:hypothetical protein